MCVTGQFIPDASILATLRNLKELSLIERYAIRDHRQFVALKLFRLQTLRLHNSSSDRSVMTLDAGAAADLPVLRTLAC